MPDASDSQWPLPAPASSRPSSKIANADADAPLALADAPFRPLELPDPFARAYAASANGFFTSGCAGAVSTSVCSAAPMVAPAGRERNASRSAHQGKDAKAQTTRMTTVMTNTVI